MVKKNATHHSLLFSGIEGIGKSLFAMEFAKLILNVETLTNHPDFYIYRPEGKLGMHSIESMRQMCEKVYTAPFLSGKKVFIIQSAEKMLPSSANSLLKTFEEPSLDTVIILMTSQPSALLPTVLSRCRHVRFHHLSESEIIRFLINNYSKSEQEAKHLAILSEGSLGKAINLAKNESDLIRKTLIELLAKGKVKHYFEITHAARAIQQHVEELKAQDETSIKALFTKDYQTEMTAAQQHNLNKEIEGAISIKQSDLANSIFDILLSWYRDLHLLKAGAKPSYLINCDYELKVESLKNAPLHSIETIQKMILEAKLLLERSTSLNIVLENLFLKLL